MIAIDKAKKQNNGKFIRVCIDGPPQETSLNSAFSFQIVATWSERSL
jgi:hypothetical protein